MYAFIHIHFSPTANMWSSPRKLISPFLLFSLQFFMLIIESKKLNRVLINNSISAVVVFGDSTVDSGNNNYIINTAYKSNYPPYGQDFPNGVPTGRFTDGRLVTDFFASYVGIKEYVPPYLNSSLGVEELMTGVSFASAGSGFDPLTAKLNGVISMKKQLEYFKEYKSKLEAVIGEERTKILINKAAFVISAGTNDMVLNYFGTPFRRLTYNTTTYQYFLLQHARQFIEGLRNEGARMILVAGVPPIGCLPIVITFTSTGVKALHRRSCTDSLSSIALDYNHKIKNMLTNMQNSTSPLVYADVYQPLINMIQKPSQYGFDTVNVGCCGSGFVETIFMCNPRSVVCSNPSKYIFFDSVHPTGAAYYHLFKALRPTIDLFI